MALLRKAKARIADPAKWTKGWIVKDTHGRHLSWGSIDDPDSCLCADGALFAVKPAGAMPIGLSLSLTLAAKSFGYEMASKFNDAPETKHADVMRLFDKAAEIAEGM